MIWSTIIRQILLRGGFYAGNAATLNADYISAPISDASITKNKAEYSFAAVTDSIIKAMTMIVAEIGNNRESEYRGHFLAETSPILNGSPIPKVSSAGVPRFGLIRNVREYIAPSELVGVENYVPRELTQSPRESVFIANRQHARISPQFKFYTDDVNLWHTVNSATAQIVAWNAEAERTAIYSNNNSAICPLPLELLPALEFGSLSFIYRDTFNVENAMAHSQKFAVELNKIAGKPSPDTELPKDA